MPRQPFLKVIGERDTSSMWGPEAIADHPLTERIGAAIGAWSHVEARVCWLLAGLTGQHAEIIADIYSELMIAGSQSAKILEIAAQRGLQRDDLHLFRAIRKIHNARIKDRHDLAHGLWGVCHGMPEGLIWTHMKNDLKWTAEWESARASNDFNRRTIDMKSHWYVYRKADFDLIIRDFVKLAKYWTLLGHLVTYYTMQDSPKLRAKADAERLELMNAPPIRRLLEESDLG